MSKVQKLRSLVNQRLTAAVEEIFGLFERTIAEYEEEVSRSKQENERQRKLLDAVFNPEVRLHRTALPQQLLVSKEEVPPEQQEWSPSLEQEEPEPPHIKEEQEEVWSSQEGEQLQGLEEADITKFPFTPVPVKSEDDEEKAQSSQLHQSQSEENREAEPLASSSTEQMETEADGEDCGLSQPDRNLDPARDLQPTSDGQLLSSHSSEAETEDSEDDSSENRVLDGAVKPAWLRVLADNSREPHLSQLLSRGTEDVVAEKKRVKTRMSALMEGHKAEMTAMREDLKNMLHELKEENRQLRTALSARKTQPDAPAPVTSAGRPAARPRLPSRPNQRTAATSAAAAGSIQTDHSDPPNAPLCALPKQHPDMLLREVTSEDHESLYKLSQGRVDRYGCLLFRFVTPEEKYRAWCVTTNWDGSRGKCELPRNLKEFIISTVRERFPAMDNKHEKMLVNRINEVLRTPRQFAMGLIR